MEKNSKKPLVSVCGNIYVTTDPSIFINARENRPIIENNKKLYQSIQEYGMLMEMPIVVIRGEVINNVQFYTIVDGGQRIHNYLRVLEVLRQYDPNAELPIYFIISENVDNYAKTLVTFNNTQSKWTTADYVHFWLTVRDDKSLESAPFRAVEQLVNEFAPTSKKKPYDTFLSILLHNKYNKQKMMEGHLPQVDVDFFRNVMGLFITAKKENENFPMGKSEFTKAFVNFYTHIYPSLTSTQQRHFIANLMKCDSEKNGVENQYMEFFLWSKVATTKEDAKIRAMQFKKDCRKLNKA